MRLTDQLDTILKAPAKVLGLLRPGYLKVIVLSGYGMADGGIHHDIPLEIVPPDLRLPNSEFTLLLDRSVGRFVGVERRNTTEDNDAHSGR